MKISDIINREEFIISDVSSEIEFDKLTTDLNQVSKEDILIIPNSKKYVKDKTGYRIATRLFLAN